jgi:hypothetical protein
MTRATSTEQLFSRRNAALAMAAFALAPRMSQAVTAAVPLDVWKDPSCGCCKDWVAHMEANGFLVTVHETGNNAIRARLGIDRKYGSCHTAVVGRYAIEGHVPARDVHRLLKEKPTAIGLAVPGMPVGSPGMDGEVYGGRKDEYSVMLLARDGTASVYQKYPAGRK